MLVETKELKKIYSSNGTAVEALRDVGIGIREGDFVAVTGESGSGKTTLLSVLGGIAPPTSGEVLVDGISVYDLPAERLADFRREYIGFVFQQFHLIPYLSAVENVMLPLCIMGENGMEELSHEALDRVGLSGKARRLPSELSGGEQQRVAIARALVNEPPIILADEPTGNLDTKTGEEIFHLFKELNKTGQTVILVTHNPNLAKRTGWTVNMKDGAVVSVREN
jgi:putative ABC transport system ATP-binding protein